MDPRNGEILALVSSPSYNPNLFARRLQQADWKALIDDPNHPLQNRAIQNTYSPGSTFKIVMETAGLTEKHLRHAHDGRLLRRQGLLRPPVPLLAERRATARWTPTWRSSSPATSTSTPSARRWASRRSPAMPACSAWARRPASTSRARSAGRCPIRNGARKQPWYPGETISVSIGQGPVLVTPAADGRDDGPASPTAATRSSPHLIKDARLPPPSTCRSTRTPCAPCAAAWWGWSTSRGAPAYGSARLPGVAIARQDRHRAGHRAGPAHRRAQPPFQIPRPRLVHLLRSGRQPASWW